MKKIRKKYNKSNKCVEKDLQLFKKERNIKIYQLYQSGFSYRKIASMYGISNTAIANIVKRVIKYIDMGILSIDN